MKISFYFFILFFNFFELTIAADDLSEKLSFWNKGMDYKAYIKCKKRLDSCPGEGLIKDQTCISKKTNTYASCKQLVKIADWLDVSANLVEIKRFKNLTLLKANYVADGQTISYIVTPDGTIYNSTIDIRKINKMLQKKYKSDDFFISSWGDWKTSIDKNKECHLSILQKITNTCLACPVLLWAKLSYVFDSDGKLLHTNALQVKAQKNSESPLKDKNDEERSKNCNK